MFAKRPFASPTTTDGAQKPISNKLKKLCFELNYYQQNVEKVCVTGFFVSVNYVNVICFKKLN